MSQNCSSVASGVRGRLAAHTSTFATEGTNIVRHRLTDDQWECIQHVLPPPARTGRPPRDRRTVIDGILWILRAGSPWRDLPKELSPWQTVWRLFDKWNKDGTLDKTSTTCGRHVSTPATSTGSCGASTARSSGLTVVRPEVVFVARRSARPAG
ncbi:MAG: transposase [Planctomycetota bacterium]